MPDDQAEARETEPYTPEQDARLQALAQILAEVIKRKVDAEIKQSRRHKSV